MASSFVILQNADFESPGLLLEWAEKKKLPVTVVKVFEGEAFPDAGEISHLAILGSPHSVNEMKTVPWIASEAQYVVSCLRGGKKVLGICFGAQLLAHLLGGTVKVGAHSEVGWHQLEIAKDKNLSALSPLAGKSFPLFQWHRDIFTLPNGATAFGKSAATALQGFEWKDHVLAMSGHPEITPALVKAFIDKCWTAEWYRKQTNTKFIQQPEQMLAEAERHLKGNSKMIFELFDRWSRL
ncbi:MAG: type 1 glutamine amidotransferase [Bdellovibrionota bacterium]